MTATILSGVIGIFFLVGAIMQLRRRGPIWSAEYLSSSVRERKKMRSVRAYRWSGLQCFLIGGAFLLFMIYGLTDLTPFLYAACVLIALLVLCLLRSCVKAVRRSTMRKPDAAVLRTGLDDEVDE